MPKRSITEDCHPNSEYQYTHRVYGFRCPFCGSDKMELGVRKLRDKNAGHKASFGCDHCGVSVGLGLFGCGLDRKWIVQYCRRQYRNWRCHPDTVAQDHKFVARKNQSLFTCTWAVFPKRGRSSICYCTDETRAEMVARALDRFCWSDQGKNWLRQHNDEQSRNPKR